MGFRDQTRLGLHYLYGRVSACVIADGQVVRSMEYSERCASPQELARIAGDLAQKLSFRGRDVSVVFGDLSMLSVMVPLPPMHGRDLKQYLERRARQEWKNKESFRLAWSELKTRDGRAVLLQIVPEIWLREIVHLCRKKNWQPAHFLTVSGAAVHHLQEEPGVQLLALNTGNTALLAVRRGSDPPVLVRELSTTWTSGADGPMRVAQEIQRTHLFAKQQLGAPVDRLVLWGSGAQLLAQVGQAVTGLNMIARDHDVPWSLPLERAAQSGSENLFSSKERAHNAERRRMLVLLGLQWIALAVLGTAYFHTGRILRDEDRQLAAMDIVGETERLREEKSALRAVYGEIQRNRALADTVRGLTRYPLAGWMAGAVADLLPDGLVLKHLEIRRDSAGYWISLEGLVPRNPLIAARLLEKFERELRELAGDYEVQISWEHTWIENLKYGASWETEEQTKPFLIRGRIR